jgi:hypothetical protein
MSCHLLLWPFRNKLLKYNDALLILLHRVVIILRGFEGM